MLKKKKVLLCSILAALLSLFWCSSFRNDIYENTLKQESDIKTSLLIYPDEIKVNGNQYSAIAKDLSNRQKVQIYGYIKSHAEQKQILAINQTTVWQIEGKNSPILPATNENQFDAVQFNLTKKIYNQISVKELKNIHQINLTGNMRLIQWCHDFRMVLINRFNTLPATTSDYCNSLLIGNSPSDFYQKMSGIKQLGLIHLFSISGMHVVIFISILRGILVRLHFNREWTVWILILILPTYLIIGGGSSSLIRSILMAEIMLLGKAKICQFSQLDIWSIGLLVGLLVQPNVLLTLGGQLSYLLALMIQFLPSQHDDLKNAILLNVIGLPSILYFVYEWHALSLLASYLMIPFFSVVVFPLVIMVALFGEQAPQLTSIVEKLLQIFQNIINKIGELPGLIHFGKPALFLVWVLFILSLWVFADSNNKRKWSMLVGCYLVTFVVIHYPIQGEVTFFDIGQGDSFLITTPYNRSVTMIDTGGQLSFPKPNWAQGICPTSKAMRVSVNYLKSKGISHIDTLCLSHQDTDHIGFSSDILKQLRVRQIIYPAGMEQQPNFKHKVLPLAQRQKSKLIPVTNESNVPGLPLQILHPFVAGKGANEDSMVLYGEFGQKSFMFMGDLDRAGELEVIEKYPKIHADVLKLGHHGSKTASDPKFIQAINPKLAIISAGRKNRYGHPNNETMKTLKNNQIPSLSTQKYGMIKYQFNILQRNSWEMKLKGDELKWMLPPYENS